MTNYTLKLGDTLPYIIVTINYAKKDLPASWSGQLYIVDSSDTEIYHQDFLRDNRQFKDTLRDYSFLKPNTTYTIKIVIKNSSDGFTKTILRKLKVTE